MPSRPNKTESDATAAMNAPTDPTRRAFLDKSAASTGQAWSSTIRKTLLEQGRAASGGFPGTMSEVRTQVITMVGVALRNARMSVLLPEEREWSVRVAYAAARKDWLAHGVREAEDDED